MKVFKIFLTLAALFPVLSLGQQAERGTVDGELLVKFRPDASVDASRAVNQKNGAVALEKLGDIGWQRVKLPIGRKADEAMAKYLESEIVEAVQPNFYYHLLATPNDASYGSLWGMAKISAPQAWDLSTGSPSVVIANIDTGVKYNHEDLAANMWTNSGEINSNGLDDDGNGFVDDYYGYDFFFNDGDPIDENGHGTHTAGTLGAVGNNSLGVVGVNWNVRIMAIKIYDNDGSGTTSAMLINAYNYVRMMKNRGVNIRVTNNSYGGCDEACGYDQATKDAIDAMGSAGILNVYAAGNVNQTCVGNDDVDPHYPNSYSSPSILAVAASTQDDTRAGFSCYGPVSVDLAAPGAGILSTTFSSTSSYGPLNGTSMATPHVAGAAALLAAHNPALSAASLKATLMNSVDLLAAWSGLVKTGGRLNVARALQNQTVCNFSVPGNTIRVPTKGGHFSIDVSAAQNCDYQVRSSANWLKQSSSDSLSGNGTVTFRVTVNPTITRSAILNVGGTEVTILQSRN